MHRPLEAGEKRTDLKVGHYKGWGKAGSIRDAGIERSVARE